MNNMIPLSNLIESPQPTITFLIGPPASGKSTWVSQYGKGATIISRDDIVDRLRRGTGMSYSETFKDQPFQKTVNSELQSHINSTLSSGKDIVVDMTNMNKGSRNKILSRVPKGYIKNAVVFKVSRDELIRRLEKREKETGKRVGLDVVDSMMSSYEAPTKLEGFDNITYFR
jgi:predicted kinase